MSKYAEIAKSWYDKGKWNKDRLAHLVEAHKISEAEYKEITGEAYIPINA